MPTCPNDGSFSAWAAQYSLEIRQDSCGKIVCQTKKSLAAGHIAIFQTRPSCKSFSDMVDRLLSEGCVAASFYQRAGNYVPFLRNLFYLIHFSELPHRPPGPQHGFFRPRAMALVEQLDFWQNHVFLCDGHAGKVLRYLANCNALLFQDFPVFSSISPCFSRIAKIFSSLFMMVRLCIKLKRFFIFSTLRIR